MSLPQLYLKAEGDHKMINSEVKKLWIESLRSGKYKQAKGQLRKINEKEGEYSYCCLGVLSDCFVNDGKQDVAWESDQLDSELGYLPTSVFNWATDSTESNPLSTFDFYILFKDLPKEIQKHILEVSPRSGIHALDEESRKERQIFLTSLNDTYGLSFSMIADIIEKHELHVDCLD